MTIFRRGIWLRSDFLKLWAGQATSMFGSLIGGFAFSLVAVITLSASPAQIAVLNGCSLLPGMLAAPWIGVLVDRRRRRSLLILADVCRAMALVSIPVAALLHQLTMLQLDAVAAIISILTMGFDVSFRAYVPSIIGRDELIQGNSTLQGTAAVAEAGGFAMAGVLVQLVTAPLAIAFDAISFVLSAFSLTSIHSHEVATTKSVDTEPSRTLTDIAEGARAVWGDPILRAITVTECAWKLIDNSVGVVIMLFFVRDLHLQPATMGPVFGIGGISAFAGAVVAGRMLRRWGRGRAMIGGIYVNNIGLLATVAAGGPFLLILALLSLAQLTDGGRTIYEISALTLMQERAPSGKEGRVFATFETLRSGAMLLGIVSGGILGESIGLRPVLILAVVGGLLAPLFLVFSPMRELTEQHAETRSAV